MSHEEDNVLYYETSYGVVRWEYTASANLDVIDFKEMWRETRPWRGIKQYVDQVVEDLKHTVIRTLPDLNKVDVTVTVFDSQNIFHRLAILASQWWSGRAALSNYDKTIFIVIMYEKKNVLVVKLNFDGLI